MGMETGLTVKEAFESAAPLILALSETETGDPANVGFPHPSKSWICSVGDCWDCPRTRDGGQEGQRCRRTGGECHSGRSGNSQKIPVGRAAHLDREDLRPLGLGYGGRNPLVKELEVLARSKAAINLNRNDPPAAGRPPRNAESRSRSNIEISRL